MRFFEGFANTAKLRHELALRALGIGNQGGEPLRPVDDDEVGRQTPKPAEKGLMTSCLKATEQHFVPLR